MIPPGSRTWGMWFHIAEHEKALEQQKMQQPQQSGTGQEGQNKVSESISFKDLPPDGQKQMAQQAGIQLDEVNLQANQEQPNSSNSAPPKGGQIKVGAEKKSPTAAAAPLKTAINPSNQLIKQQ